MRRRVRVVRADHALDLAQHAVGLVLRLADDAQRADPLAVEREALREARGHEEVEPAVDEAGDDRAVFGNALAEPLIGHVEEGHQAARLDRGDQLLPLVRRDVVAGRVVAAGVQRDDRAGRCAVERREHRVEVDAALGRVVVRVVLDDEAGAFEQGAMVLPARVADQHLCAGIHPLEEIGADLQRTGAADRLRRGDASGLDSLAVGSKYQCLDGLVVYRDAVDRQVAAGLRRFDHLLLGFGDALEQRQLAVVVVVHADSEVHLGRIRVGVELFVQTEDRIPWCQFNGGEERSHNSPCQQSLSVERVVDLGYAY